MKIHQISDFDELWSRSIQDINWFNEALLTYLDIRFRKPYSKIVDLSSGIAWPKWCVEGQMNIVESCLDKHIATPTENRTAVLWEGEDGQTNSITYRELFLQINRSSNALRNFGLGKGDVIGLFMPMTLEIIVAMLAIARIGGVILPLFSGYGIQAVASRLSNAEAKALFTADGFYRRGKLIPLKSVADEAAEQVPSLQHIVVVNRASHPVLMKEGRDYWWHDFISWGHETADTAITSAEDPLLLLYTSGTSGRPKGAVHTHCGFPVKAAQDMAFGTDIHPGERIFWVTDMGWMMGPWLAFGTLILGGTFLIYDGSPDYPHPGRLWEMVAHHRINALGISPTLIRALLPYGDRWVREYDLSHLRILASTGEPWNPTPWMWLFQTIGKGKLPIINYSGGTEISGGILMGNPILPLKPCAFSAPCPGIAADVFDESGNSVQGQVGELVIKAPWIGMTRGFWKDPERYENDYWTRWSGIWVHGDFAMIDDDGQWYILGRSDDTIKVAGKRIAPAEIESLLVHHTSVMEAAAIGVPDDVKGNQVIAFCVLTDDALQTAELSQELEALIIKNLGKPLTPREIIFVDDLPKTRNGKIMRRIIRSSYLGTDPGDTSSLLNPEAVEEIKKARHKHE